MAKKNQQIGRRREERAWVACPGRLGAPLVLFWASEPVSWGPSAPDASRDEISTLEKSQLNLTSFSPLKDKNTQNREFLFCRVKTKIKGIIGKSPKIIIKHEHNIIYDANMWEIMSTNYKIHVCILHASTSQSLTYARPEHEGDKTNMDFGVCCFASFHCHTKFTRFNH